ncbi:NYN domain-containing protein [Sphaerospermopsis torques-reginae]|uniref:NYN domain-containing protein n=1 Tax=Sphaerospermopsis torques-reginae ITEP-024 TaxID=984208 RepID=A0ABX8WWE5_9CYAN|nr:NYN domain-containing protein [Sphaerospermopsis torques-reginae]QYX30741.1 NYN domain-containing protein [Sphaerospermopsis torques-reginae ITEP-024]
MKSVAILLDGGFVLKKLYAMLGNNHATAEDVIKFSQVCLDSDEDLFRLYYYDCQPYEQTQTNPISGTSIDFSATSACSRSKSLQNALSQSSKVAFRKGNILFKGWIIKKYSTQDIIKTGRSILDTDIQADLQQKGVDIKIGLDVASLTLKHTVERLILVTGDSDFIPAMKFARREGVQVVIISMGNSNIYSDFKEHSDEVRKVGYDPATSSFIRII